MKKTLLATAVLTLGGFSGAALADLTVAIAGPMTGQYASAGDQIRRGAEMAIADINARGGGGEARSQGRAASLRSVRVRVRSRPEPDGAWCNIPGIQFAACLPPTVSPETQPWFHTSPLP